MSNSMEYNTHLITLDNDYEIRKELANIKVDAKSIDLLVQKMSFLHLKLENVDTRAANTIKQYMGTIGGEVAISYDAYNFTEHTTDMIISGSKSDFRILIKKIMGGKNGLAEIAKEIARNIEAKITAININGKVLDFNKTCYIMGVVPFTTDMITEDPERTEIMSKIEQFVDGNATMIDICGEELYAKSIIGTISEEVTEYLAELVKEIRDKFPHLIITIDTTRAEVASACIDAGIDMINMILPLRYCENLVRIAARKKCPVALICNPQYISSQPKPFVAIPDAIREIQSNMSYAIGLGIDRKNIIIDPGIGFGKNDDDNFLLLKQLTSFKYFNRPLLVGLSRKSFLRSALKGKLDHSLVSTIITNTIAIINGANIVRVHTQEEAKVMKILINATSKSDSEE